MNLIHYVLISGDQVSISDHCPNRDLHGLKRGPQRVLDGLEQGPLQVFQGLCDILTDLSENFSEVSKKIHETANETLTDRSFLPR